jgi:hypothetical protein
LRACSCAQDGDRFWRMPEIFIRGNTLKYIRIPEEVRKTAEQQGAAATAHAIEAISEQQQQCGSRQLDSAVACQPGAFCHTMAYCTRRMAQTGPHRTACTTPFATVRGSSWQDDAGI